MSYQTVKGTYDTLPERYEKCRYVEELFEQFLDLYGYRLMKTPVIEYSGVFKKYNEWTKLRC